MKHLHRSVHWGQTLLDNVESVTRLNTHQPVSYFEQFKDRTGQGSRWGIAD
jgi:hypothetical protein